MIFMFIFCAAVAMVMSCAVDMEDRPACFALILVVMVALLKWLV